MKIGIFGDLHFTNQRPGNRKDKDYLETALGKFEWSLETFSDCDIIIQPGDFFDSPRASLEVIKKVARRVIGHRFLVVKGQHDIHFHNLENKNTPLDLLEEFGAVEILGEYPIETKENVHLYGASWGEPIPKITTKGTNILVIHKMIIKDRAHKLWPGQKDYEESRKILAENSYDLVVSGDNHTSFAYSRGDKNLVNCGSLLRSTIAQRDHIPCVYIYDTMEKKFDRIEIPVKKPEEVLDFSKKERQNEIDEKLEVFVSGLKKTISASLDFEDTVHSISKDAPAGVKKVIEEIMS